jgi:hypothetical protein
MGMRREVSRALKDALDDAEVLDKESQDLRFRLKQLESENRRLSARVVEAEGALAARKSVALANRRFANKTVQKNRAEIAARVEEGVRPAREAKERAIKAEEAANEERRRYCDALQAAVEQGDKIARDNAKLCDEYRRTINRGKDIVDAAREEARAIIDMAAKEAAVIQKEAAETAAMGGFKSYEEWFVVHSKRVWKMATKPSQSPALVSAPTEPKQDRFELIELDGECSPSADWTPDKAEEYFRPLELE